MSMEMMHTILTVRNIPMSDQVELELREEQSNLLLLCARHDGDNSFVFYDADDKEKIAVLRKDDLFGLTFTLRSVDDEGLRLARIRFEASLTSKPVSFDVELGEHAISEREKESRVIGLLFLSLKLNIAACLPIESDPTSSLYSPLGIYSKPHAQVHGTLNFLTTRAPYME